MFLYELIVHSFLLLTIIPLYGYMTICLSITLFKAKVVSRFYE